MPPPCRSTPARGGPPSLCGRKAPDPLDRSRRRTAERRHTGRRTHHMTATAPDRDGRPRKLRRACRFRVRRTQSGADTSPERKKEGPRCRSNGALPDKPVRQSEDYLMILVTRPEPTVRPPSRIAKPRPSSMAMGWMSATVISVLSPGITISVPSGRVMTPVTSVVRK